MKPLPGLADSIPALESLAPAAHEAVAQVVALEAKAYVAEEEPSDIRWEQARWVAEALENGLSTRGLASKWVNPETGEAYGKSHVHRVKLCWQNFGVPLGGQERPRFNTAYHSVGRKPAASTDTPPLPAGVYSTIVADPPWEVKAGPAEWGGSAPSQALEYPTMTVDEIAALAVADHAAADAHLYVWTINKYVEETYAIVRAWGFEPSTLLTWCKPRHGIGLGGTYVLTSEFVLFARRGRLAATERVDTSWFEWPRRRHSEKPHEFYSLVESVSPGPRLEMFARVPRPGWTVWGNEVEAHAA